MKNRIYKVITTVLLLSVLLSQMSLGASAISADVQISSRFGEMLFGKKSEEHSVLIGGGIFGAKIKQSTLTVVEAKSTNELHEGDTLISLGGASVSSLSEVEDILSRSNGSPLEVVALRHGEEIRCTITPQLRSGKYKLGLKLKDTATGIGTITFIDKESGVFGGLGHGILDPTTAELIPISGGNMNGVLLGGIHKGEAGKPGELCGVLTGKRLGSITQNCECGIFGRIDKAELDTSGYEEIVCAAAGEIHTGKAEILASVKNGSPRRYSVLITEIKGEDSPTKSFRIKVTDKALIALTGGIVRGMSGSPIIQDGKLVGAVTHVMVANPTEGYGIFIENMLNATEIPMAKAS